MNKVANVLKISFIVNTILSILKIVVGTIGNSGALIADGIHSFSDLVTDLVVIISSKFSNKEPDLEHPFGHGRLDYIISIAISFVIIMLGVTIIVDSRTLKYSIPSMLVIVVTIITIIAKMYLSSYILRKGKKYKSSVLIASGIESKSDVITSVVVLISSILMIYSRDYEILRYSNILAMIIVGAFIIKTGALMFQENINILIGSAEEEEDYLNKIKKTIYKNEEIKSIDLLTLMKYGMYYHLICEVSMDGKLELIKAHDIAHKIEDDLKHKDQQIKYITIHINPYKKM